MIYRKSYRNRGIILLDILLALSLGAVFVGIVASASFTARQLFEDAHERESLLNAYEEHQASFNALMPYQSYSWNDSTTTIRATALPYGNDRIETDVNISDGIASTTFIAIRSYPFSNDSDSAGTPMCSPEFSNKEVVGSYPFLHPGVSSSTVVITQITLPIDPLLPLTDLQVRNGIAYISADSSNTSDPDLIIADIHDVNAPVIHLTMNTGSGIASIALAGNYIFAAASSAAGQLHVIRLNSLDSPVLEAKYRLPPPYATATEPLGSSIFFDKGKVYLGTEKWDGQEFSIIDVSNPAAPAKVGGLEIGAKVNSIFVTQGTAYIATAAHAQLSEADIIDPSHSYIFGQFGPSGWQRQEGTAISVFEDALSFGRTSGGFDIPADRELFAWATTSSSIFVGPSTLNVPGGVYGIVADRDRLYIATRQAGGEFMTLSRTVWDDEWGIHPLPVAPQSLTCDGGNLYLLARTAPVIYEITFNK